MTGLPAGWAADDEKTDPNGHSSHPPPPCAGRNPEGLACQLAPHDASKSHMHKVGKRVVYWTDALPPLEDAPAPATAGKRRMELVILEFVAEMALQMEGGIKDGRVAHDWKDLPVDAALQDRTGAVMRHLLAAQTRGALDPETGASHWAAIADCAMICWGLEQQTAGSAIEVPPAPEGDHEGGGS